MSHDPGDCEHRVTPTLPRVIPLSEVRVGDTVRVVDEGVVTRIDNDLDLLTVGDRNVYIGGPNLMSRPVTVELVDRPALSLPTHEGAAIVDATIRGVEGCTATRDGKGRWVTADLVAGFCYHRPEHVTAWTPAQVVADGEPVTRG